jgi:hypothetical protein
VEGSLDTPVQDPSRLLEGDVTGRLEERGQACGGAHERRREVERAGERFVEIAQVTSGLDGRLP